MADWFERKPSLLSLIGNDTISTDTKNSLDALVRALDPKSSPTALPIDYSSGFFGSGLHHSAFGTLAPLPPTPSPFSSALASLLSQTEAPYSPPPALPVTPRPAPAPQRVKRKVFFSFHFDDLWRVNNVRQCWKIIDPNMRGFYDRSLWESKKLEGADALKRLIRASMEHASALCVLVGSQTWSRRWVKYEIARSVVDQRGLLAVHINGLNHHQRRTPDALGFNPLNLMGVFHSVNGNFYLYEKREVIVNGLTGQSEWQWLPYRDYTAAVSLPRYLTAPQVGYVMPLSTGADEDDFVASAGHNSIGAWIDRAASRAGR